MIDPSPKHVGVQVQSQALSEHLENSDDTGDLPSYPCANFYKNDQVTFEFESVQLQLNLLFQKRG